MVNTAAETKNNDFSKDFKDLNLCFPRTKIIGIKYKLCPRLTTTGL